MRGELRKKIEALASADGSQTKNLTDGGIVGDKGKKQDPWVITVGGEAWSGGCAMKPKSRPGEC